MFKIGDSWRADKNSDYWCITLSGLVKRETELGYSYNNMRWAFGNYFRTEKEARIKLDEILEVLKED